MILGVLLKPSLLVHLIQEWDIFIYLFENTCLSIISVFRFKGPERVLKSWSFSSEGCTVSISQGFQPWLQIAVTWKSFHKQACLCPSLRDSDFIDWEVRAWLLLLFKSSQGEEGMGGGVSASCGPRPSARSPTQSLCRKHGLLRACQLG